MQVFLFQWLWKLAKVCFYSKRGKPIWKPCYSAYKRAKPKSRSNHYRITKEVRYLCFKMSSRLPGRKLTMIVLSTQENLEPPQRQASRHVWRITLPTVDSSSQAVRLNEKGRGLSTQSLLSAFCLWSNASRRLESLQLWLQASMDCNQNNPLTPLGCSCQGPFFITATEKELRC